MLYNLLEISLRNVAEFKVFLSSRCGEEIRIIHFNGLAALKFSISFHQTLGNRLQSLVYRN